MGVKPCGPFARTVLTERRLGIRQIGTTGVVIQCVVCREPTGYPVEASYPLWNLRLDLLSNAWAPVFKRSAEGRWPD
jgi:hypothetical protein